MSPERALLFAGLLFVAITLVAETALKSSTIVAPTALAEIQERATPMPMDGEWWVSAQRLAAGGDAGMRSLRSGYVKGLWEGIDLMILVSSENFDTYRSRRDLVLRMDLNVEQLVSKLDGFYAETKNKDVPVRVALLKLAGPQ